MACTSVTANLARFNSPSVQDATLKKTPDWHIANDTLWKHPTKPPSSYQLPSSCYHCHNWKSPTFIPSSSLFSTSVRLSRRWDRLESSAVRRVPRRERHPMFPPPQPPVPDCSSEYGTCGAMAVLLDDCRLVRNRTTVEASFWEQRD